jgi:hypothetical protein
MPDSKPSIGQCPPGVYEVTTGSGTVFRLLSLSTTLPVSVPPFAWKKNTEHWFSPAGLKLDVALGASSMDVTYTDDLSSLQKLVDALANPALYTFQLYALGVLSKDDWISGVPSWASPAFYFESSATPKMKPLFEVSSSSQTTLAHLSWFSPDNTLTSYFQGASPGAKITVTSKATSTIPTNGYYYRSP